MGHGARFTLRARCCETVTRARFFCRAQGEVCYRLRSTEGLRMGTSKSPCIVLPIGCQ